MKTILALAALVAVCVASTLPAEVLEETMTGEERSANYQRYFEYTDEEGNVHIIDVEAPPGPEVYEADFDTRNAANNVYYLYTRTNPNLPQTLTMGNVSSIHNSNFNANHPTKVIVHGGWSTYTTEPNPTVRRAFLAKGEANVISVDWHRLAMSDYASVITGVPGVGRGLGQFLLFLNQVTSASLHTMHLVGFSLGAHVVGNAGRECGGRIARVTGLDPAGPLWLYNSNRLGASDGVYVEAIHTDGSAAGLGIGTAIARVDFFPNGGITQPGCLFSMCNHDRAWEYFAATITYNHLIGQECTSMLQMTWNTCHGGNHNMGNDILNKFGTGMYRVNTGRIYPY